MRMLIIVRCIYFQELHAAYDLTLACKWLLISEVRMYLVSLEHMDGSNWHRRSWRVWAMEVWLYLDLETGHYKKKMSFFTNKGQ